MLGHASAAMTCTAGAHGRDRPKIGRMCRNITELRGLEPPATDDEVEAAARQFIRKVSGLQKPPAGAEAAYERAIAHVTAEVHALLDMLPARRQPPATVPPLRRPEVRARIAAREAAAVGTSPADSGSDGAPRAGRGGGEHADA
jgi:hypothetical protein